MAWTQLTFGMHKGLTLPQIMFVDPGWFFWLYNEQQIVYDNQHTPKVRDEFKMIYLRSRQVIIPRNYRQKLEVRYYKITDADDDNPEESFATMEVCRKNERQFWEIETYKYITKELIDFQIPWEINYRDKMGYKSFLRKIRLWFFGPQHLNTDLAKEQCEEFFNNPDNFDKDDEIPGEFIHPYDPE